MWIYHEQFWMELSGTSICQQTHLPEKTCFCPDWICTRNLAKLIRDREQGWNGCLRPGNINKQIIGIKWYSLLKIVSSYTSDACIRQKRYSKGLDGNSKQQGGQRASLPSASEKGEKVWMVIIGSNWCEWWWIQQLNPGSVIHPKAKLL